MSVRTTENPADAVATFVSETTFDDLPGDAVRSIERAFLDTVGVTLAGATVGIGSTISAAIGGLAGGGKTGTILGGDEELGLLDACFVNATAAHSLDYDDGSSAIIGHPSVVLVPPILGMAEIEPVTGEEAIAAYAAGFETMAYIGAPILPGHYERGWHATGTLGTFGAAMASAALLDLDPDEMATAMNVAASMASGLRENFGTTTKPAHAGRSVRAGMLAAGLGKHGLTASARAIDGDTGFWNIYAGDAGVRESARFTLGSKWAILDPGIHPKKYPCCWKTHSGIAAALRLCREAAIAPADVERVRIEISPSAADVLTHPDPQTGYESKFSSEYTVASAIVRGSVGLDAFSKTSVGDPAVQAVRERVSVHVDDGLPYTSDRQHVAIETTDGTVHETTVTHPPGTAENPLSDREYEEKFMECASAVLSDATCERARVRLDSLRDCPDLRDIVDLLSSG